VLRVRQPSDAALTEALLRFSRLEPTYPELGASLDESLPPGYHHGRSSITLGRGDEVWAAACAALDQWQAHRGAGVRVFPADAPLEAGATVALSVRIGPVVDVFGCRIVQVVDEADRYGFAYGTLPGHPERGEESFVLERTEQGSVTFTVTVFAQGAQLLTRLAQPLTSAVSHQYIDRYLRSLRRACCS
jgi:uncharacterized protein (UPF0548 family)